MSDNNTPDILIGRETTLEIGGLETVDNFQIFQKYIDKYKNNVNTIPTKFFALGGIGEVGKNTYCLMHDDEIIIIDAGIKFANKKLHSGLTGVVAQIDYLKQHQEKIKALIITHGHEDHIGGIAYVLKKIKIPVIYSPVIASELIKRKLSEHQITDQPIVVYTKKSIFSTKHFLIDFFKVNHSIPDAFGVCVITPNGIVVSSGDFRFDFGSKDDKFDLQKVQEISHRKIDLLLCESTNSSQPGFNESEKLVIAELNNIISSSEGRVIITFFASNLGRIEEIIKISMNLNRKIVILGRSIDASIAASQKVGYLKINKKVFISVSEMVNYSDNEILIICTGSQGEENAVLNTISKNKHQWIKLKSSDNIIFSSNVIPGNSAAVDDVINRLYKSGCNIFVNSNHLKIHSSGHASKLEQQLFISLMNANYLIPIHGEMKMLRELKRNAIELGFSENNISILENGHVVNMLNGVVTPTEERLFVDPPIYIVGNEIADDAMQILKLREDLGKEGIMMMHAFINSKTKEIFTISPITNIGSFYISDSIQLLKKICFLMRNKFKSLFEASMSLENIKKECSNFLQDEIFKAKKQKPIIKLFITDADKNELWENSIKADPSSSEPFPNPTTPPLVNEQLL